MAGVQDRIVIVDRYNHACSAYQSAVAGLKLALIHIYSYGEVCVLQHHQELIRCGASSINMLAIRTSLKRGTDCLRSRASRPWWSVSGGLSSGNPRRTGQSDVRLPPSHHGYRSGAAAVVRIRNHASPRRIPSPSHDCTLRKSHVHSGPVDRSPGLGRRR